MGKITGGQLVAKFANAEGIGAIFTLCGGHVMDIYNGCAEEGIKIIDVRHEQTAAHAADAWTRLTGFPGLAVVTAGPGVTDAVTGVANAFRAQVPMLLIGGQVPLNSLLKGGLQELNNVEIMKPITKFSATVFETERIPEYMAMALREAYSGRPGPSFLEIPYDVLASALEETQVRIPSGYRAKGGTRPDPGDVERAAELLDRADRPAILAGTQVWLCRAVDSLKALAEKMQIPTYLNGAARGAFAPDSKFLFSRSRSHALSRADVVIVVGTPFDFRLGYGDRIAPGAKIIQVDLDYSELCHNRSTDVPINADIGPALKDLLEAVSLRADRDVWRRELRAKENEILEKEREFLTSDEVPIHPLRLAREINDFLSDDSIFIADGGDVVTISANVIRTRKPGKWLDPGPLGTLGVGTPFAIAAKTAFPSTEVVALFGDGAFGCTGFDYDTLIRFNLPVVGIVANNAAWNQVRFLQLARYGPDRGNLASVLTPLRYDRVIEAMGGYGEQVVLPSEIRPALERAGSSGKPACVNVIVNRDVFSASTKSMSIYR
ncbi:Thiamine pyrophosphate enzyme TPP binding domain protein [Syntrophobacter sp. SbD1]|nr:Thiamine pyrophosphate enzyme TPP binding domain protein [Syntrophobacter sp. SbD1]